MQQYAAVGFPGAIGCTDVVHIWWDRCPTSLINLYTGKEGYPTIQDAATAQQIKNLFSKMRSDLESKE